MLPHNTSLARKIYSQEHGTPTWILDEIVRPLCGEIDIDLASNEEHNKIVKAKIFFTKDCPTRSDALTANFRGCIWCNPPGSDNRQRPPLPIQFWNLFLSVIRQNSPGAFLIFNVDHVRLLDKSSRDYYLLFFKKRIKYQGAKSQASFSSALAIFPRKEINQEQVLTTLKKYGNVFKPTR